MIGTHEQARKKHISFWQQASTPKISASDDVVM